MTDKTFGTDVSQESLVAEAVDDFEQLLHGGEHPDIEQYVQRYPGISDVLRRLLPVLEVMDGSDPGPDGKEPRTLGDFRIQRELGRGGMGVVYEAEQISLARKVALKVLPFAAVMDPRQLQRFRNEAQAAAHLHHTHIVPVYSVGCERGVHYFAMQFIEGLTVAQAIEELRAFAGQDAPRGSSSAALEAITKGKSTRSAAYCQGVARLGIQAAEALDHAHQQGVVHRDIKPANLIVDHGGQLWITDFGLASFASNPGVTTTGDLVGTVRYMSPEQATAKRAPIDHRTDIYSLGVTLYELLTLETAFKGDDPRQVIQDIALREPASARSLNPGVPAEFETILLKTMAKRPEERYDTARALAEDLGRFLEDRPIQARRPGLAKRAEKWARRHRAAVGAAAALLALALAGLATGAALLWRERARTEQAYEAEAHQRALAETNLSLALEALDQVYLDEAEVTPTLRPGLSRDLLEKGLGFYERFGAENRNNPDVRREAGRALARAGLIYRKLGRRGEAAEALDAAVASLRDVIRVRPDWAQAHDDLGDALWTNGQVDDAIAAFREAIRLDPRLPEAYQTLGVVLCDGKHDYVGATAAFREAIRLKPDYTCAHSNLGVALSEKGEFDEAVEACREALRLKPDFGHAHAILGKALAGKGQIDDAIIELREGIRLEPELAFAHAILGKALAGKGQIDDAIAAFREVICLEPDSALAHDTLGKALAEEGQIDEAIAAFREAIRLKPDQAEPYSHLGSALRMRGLHDEAIAAHREAIRLKPDDAAAHYNLGNAFRAKGLLDEAIAAYREAIRLKPDSVEAHGNLGSALGARGLHDEAIASYREAIRLKPDCAKAHYALGSALGANGRVDEAIAAYREAIRLAPSAQSCNDLAWLLATCPDERLRNPEAAVALAKKAASLAPGDGGLVNTLGVAQYRAGHFREALDALEQSMRLRAGGNASDWLFVAMAKWREGDRDEARAWYDKSLAWMKEHAPDDPELKRFAAEATDLMEAKKN